MGELRCQRCDGPLTAKAGQTIILPTVTVTMRPDDPPGSLGKVERVNNGGWCGDCVAELDEVIGGAV